LNLINYYISWRGSINGLQMYMCRGVALICY